MLRYADVVVHRQLLAALGSAPLSGTEAVSTAPPVMPHAELSVAAHTMNERHRRCESEMCGVIALSDVY